MKNIKLLIITLLFSSLLMACGMKGPLYRTPVAQPAPPSAMENKEKSEAKQDNATTATTEEQANCSENTAAADKQQAVTEQDNATNATTEELTNCSENTTAADKQQAVAEQGKSENTTASE